MIDVQAEGVTRLRPVPRSKTTDDAGRRAARQPVPDPPGPAAPTSPAAPRPARRIAMEARRQLESQLYHVW